MEKLVVLGALLLLVPAAASQEPFEIREDSCNDGETNLFSMYEKKGGNIAEPGYFRWQACSAVIDYSEVRDECEPGESSLISMKSKEDAHASIYSEYRWDVCIPRAVVTLNKTCVNSDPIASMHSETDSHIAEPGYFENQVCHSFADVNTMTLKLEIESSDVYIDGETAEERTYSPIELEYPYIVSDRPAGIVSYGDLKNITYTENSRNVLSVTQRDGSFLLPFTRGGTESIDRRQEDITSRTFLQEYDPSFGFFIPDNPVIKVIYDFGYGTEGFTETQTNRIDLAVRNKFNDSDKTELLITDR